LAIWKGRLVNCDCGAWWKAPVPLAEGKIDLTAAGYRQRDNWE